MFNKIKNFNICMSNYSKKVDRTKYIENKYINGESIFCTATLRHNQENVCQFGNINKIY